MPDYENDDLALKFESEYLFVADSEPSRFIFESHGKLVLTDCDDSENEIEVGTFRTILVDVISAINEHESVFDVFDSNSSTINYYEELYDPDEDYFHSRVVKSVFGDDSLWNPNLLIIDRLIVYKEHRGHGYCLQAIQGLIHRLRMGAGLIALKPFPLQFESTYLDGKNMEE